MGFRLSVAAEEDIIAIAEEGMRLFGAAQTGLYHEQLFAIPPMRIHPFKAHLVVYRIEADGHILIVRIRHGHEDWSGDVP
ncbi:plasmid stabilization protein ParE [Mesorhizobium sp. WSM4312]|uniref:type II toxin-antitoxin system RelE/ParE family toxin n=1 Tax=Mesorhizobium sp. WSM4312 TaxID=2029411 RepID=UPI000BB0A2C0|nr:type II toxin-antitoxin system RelE/ParE family toxin [Mesorhizobium sp. WSM4312]PBB64827.1 plasmid stabilization protein ParE [Mesorhizobium sp. WSM4312]